MADAHTEHETPATPASTGSSSNTVDQLFNKIHEYIGQKISTFMAFLFFLFTIGAVFGAITILRFPNLAPFMILAPAVFGLVAYYNRTVGTIAFVLLIILFII